MEVKCYCCDNEITKENESEEHILLNAIGGKLKSKTLLCKRCNSNFGESFDSELSKQLLFISSFLNIDRERGNHPPLKGGKTDSGEEIHLLAGGKPIYGKPTVESTKNGNEVVLNIKARSKKELRKILKGLNRKYPQIDIDNIIENSDLETSYLNEPIKITQTIGGDKALNGITKTALNYGVYINKDYEPFKKVIEILKKVEKNLLCKHFYPKNLYRKERQEICHIIHVQSDKRNKNIVAYVEFFSSYSFIILLSDSYIGKKIKSTYCYDLKRKKELKKEINLKITSEEFEKLPTISPDHYPLITEKMDRIVQIGLKEQDKDAISNLTSRCVDEILVKKYGNEPVITERMINELSNLLATEYVKFAYRK